MAKDVAIRFLRNFFNLQPPQVQVFSSSNTGRYVHLVHRDDDSRRFSLEFESPTSAEVFRCAREAMGWLQAQVSLFPMAKPRRILFATPLVLTFSSQGLPALSRRGS